MKPIRELVHDRVACERIASFFSMNEPTNIISDKEGKCVVIMSDGDLVLLTSDGYFYIQRMLGGHGGYNPFQFVKLMNELGYAPDLHRGKTT